MLAPRFMKLFSLCIGPGKRTLIDGKLAIPAEASPRMSGSFAEIFNFVVGLSDLAWYVSLLGFVSL